MCSEGGEGVGISGARSHPGPWFHVLSGEGVGYPGGKVYGGRGRVIGYLWG